MIKMSRIIFTLRRAVMSYQNGFGGNDLAGRGAMTGGRRGGRQDTTREGLCCVCLLFDYSNCSSPVFFFLSTSMAVYTHKCSKDLEGI